MTRAIILYNPKAGRGTSVKLAKEAVELFRKHDIDLKPQHLQFGVNPFTNEMDVELVIVCGGDGSINYVVNCMRQVGINPTLAGVIGFGLGVVIIIVTDRILQKKDNTVYTIKSFAPGLGRGAGQGEHNHD